MIGLTFDGNLLTAATLTDGGEILRRQNNRHRVMTIANGCSLYPH